MNPYIAHPDHIPKDDRYADLPLYGRYYPRPDDFRIDVRHANSTSPESLRYWEAVLGLCTESNLIYPETQTKVGMYLPSAVSLSNLAIGMKAQR
ncbi:hypothetical protein HDV57DRAFT_6871 [Trichoderma longibrachiatum]